MKTEGDYIKYEQVIEGEKRERDPRTYGQRNTRERPVNVEDTGGVRDRAKGYEYIYIFKSISKLHKRLQPIRPAKHMPMLVRQRTQGIRWRYCRKHTGVPRSSTSLPKPAERSYGERQRRSVQLRSDSTSSSPMRDPHPSPSPLLL